MEEFFLPSKLCFLLQALETFIVQISNSDHRIDFVCFAENYISSIYRRTRDFTESLILSKICIYDVQGHEMSEKTVFALKELNSLLLTWMKFKRNRIFRTSTFQMINDEQRFINYLISIINSLLRFRCDFERLKLYFLKRILISTV